MKIHKEGYLIILTFFLALALIDVAVGFWLGTGWLFYVITAALLVYFFFICRFFRVPSRVPVLGDTLVTAPADGTIVIIKEVDENEYLKTRCRQVSIFMSVFNVHANYFPVSGTVEYYKYHPGKYLVAYHEKSSEKNERTSVVVNHNGTKILFRQIAGLLARRIVCYAKEGTTVQQGQETGFIKFGSRVDIFLPLTADVKVKVGDKTRATQTVIAELK